jgi:hypothetical protein
MEKKDYTVLTDGRFVAGVRNPGKGETISLTDLQAEHPLRTLEIKPATTEPAVTKTEQVALIVPKAATPPAA